MTESTTSLGSLLRNVRNQRNLSQQSLAQTLEVGVRDIETLEAGGSDVEATLLERYAEALLNPAASEKKPVMNLHIDGPTQLSGAIDVRSSKNAAVALLCSSLLNKGTTTLRGIARIEEVARILEVLESIGIVATWSADGRDLTLKRPAELDLASMDVEAARRTRSIIMFMGPLTHMLGEFQLPYAGGCDLGARTVTPHLQALHHFGLDVVATEGWYKASVRVNEDGVKNITLTERGDTVTENVLMAAALDPGLTVIRNASPNYMVQDVCFFLQSLGVQIEGIGTTTLKVRGVAEIDVDVTATPSEDPIEAMSLITAAIVTNSEVTVQRCPIEFLEIELSILEEMGLRYEMSQEYAAANGFTRLVDITVLPSILKAPADKIHPLPFPGLNIDNLPFFAVIAACAEGTTMLHDWVYENRAIHLVELNKLGANTQLLDPHRLMITGPTRWRPADMFCPPALRPSVCLLLAALAGSGRTTLRNIYVINRGYEDLPNRLNQLGAHIEVFYE